MGRRKLNIVLPHLVNGDDMSKAGFVEYKLRNPRTGIMERFRVYQGINNAKSAEQRQKVGAQIVHDINQRLADGWSPFEQMKLTYEDLLTEQRITARWGTVAQTPINMTYYINEFLQWKKPAVIPHSFQTYASKLRIFHEWLEREGLSDKHPSLVDQPVFVRFITTMCERLGWSRRTVTKYQQILHHFYEYLIEHGVARSNPIYGIPAVGERRDEAAKPIPEEIRKLLLTTMRQEEPQLALVCELEYYCAIRPNELRQLRIRDIDLRSASIRIPANISKNRTTQSVDLPRQMLEKLRQWKVDEYPPHFFLLGTQGVPGIEGYGKNTLRFRFERIREKLHLSSEYKLYSFKHSGGVELVNAGVDTWQLQRHFRHSSIATTEAYLRRNFAPNSEMIKDHFPDI